MKLTVKNLLRLSDAASENSLITCVIQHFTFTFDRHAAFCFSANNIYLEATSGGLNRHKKLLD